MPILSFRAMFFMLERVLTRLFAVNFYANRLAFSTILHCI